MTVETVTDQGAWGATTRLRARVARVRDRASGGEPATEHGVGRREVIVLALFALTVRLLYWRFVTPGWTSRADADQYVLLARSLASGDGYSLVFPGLEPHATAFRPPLLPMLFSPAAALFPDALWPFRLIGAVLGSAVAVLGARFSGEIAGQRAALVTGGLLAVHPPLLANDTVALTEPLALALLLATMLAARHRRPAMAGSFAGLLLLTRPNAYVVLLVVAVAVALPWRGRRSIRPALTVMAVAVLVVAPWSIRNAVQVGTARLTTSDGFTTAAVWSPEAQAAEDFVDPVYDEAFDDPLYRWAQLDEARWSRMLADRALEGLRADPGHVVGLAWRNALGYFELQPERNRWPEDNDGRNWGFRQATLPLYWAVTIAGSVGIVLHRRHGHVILLGIITAQFVLLSLVLVASPRLRAPFDLMCCIGVGLLAALLPRPARA